MRVLLLAYHFEPSNEIGAFRPTSLARYLTARGDQVRVIARGEAEKPPEMESRYDGIPVLRISNPPGLVQCVFARLRVQSSATSADARRGSSDSRPGGHVLDRVSLVGRSLLHIPDSSLPWARAAFAAGVGATRGWRPDVIVVSGPPFSSFIAADRLSRRLKVPWVADYRDLWSNSTYYPYPDARRSVDRLIERVTMRGAASLVTVSQPLADDLGRLHHRRAAVVLNGHHPRDAGSDEPERLPGRLNLVHAGTLSNGKRDPRPIFEAVALLGAEAAGIRVHFAGPPSDLAVRSAQDAGLPDHLMDHGQLNRAEALHLEHRADVLLLLMWNDEGEAGIYSGKLFEYLFARRPILMLGWPHGVAADLIRNRGAGVVLNDPAEIAGQLRTWLAEAATPGGIPSLPASVTAGLTRDEQNGEFARIIERSARL